MLIKSVEAYIRNEKGCARRLGAIAASSGFDSTLMEKADIIACAVVRSYSPNKAKVVYWYPCPHKFTVTSVTFGKELTIDNNNNNMPVRTALDELGKDGSFVRSDAAWRNRISREEGAQFPPEKDRYHLYVAYACPWAHRTLMVRAIKGLEEVISVTKVMPVWVKTKPDYETDTHTGWMFANPNGEPRPNSIGLGGPFPSSYPENQPDPELGALTIRELYEKAGDTEGKYSVPVLWDKKLKTIVSNESAEIIRMFNSEFNEFAKYPDINLAPEDMEEGMKAVDDWIYPTINNGVYRCGFAKSQGAYDQAIVELTASFDRIEEILSKQRYIAGDKFTLSDVRLFVTLLRFDEVYVVYFKTNTRTVASSPAILNYLREIYQMQGVKDTVNMDQIKLHYFASHPSLNQWSIIPHGPGTIKQLEKEHNRASL